VQESLFPTAMPLIPGWEFAATCRTARVVGGDYYDVFEVGSNKVLFAQGDVMGKSVGASLTMASVHAMIRSAGLSLGEEGTPASLAQELNRYLIGSRTPDMFVTLFVGLIDVDRNRLRYVNCGHPPGLLLQQAGSEPRELAVGGMVLGIMEDATFDTGECDLAVGDTLVLVSDGVTEAANPRDEMYGDRLLIEVLSAGKGLGAIENMQRVLDSVDGFTEDAPQRDDISILVLRKAA
jgi:sigma-B regulation protein RsbU (phosphoserine phosphatase)